MAIDYIVVLMWIIGFLLILFLVDRYIISRWRHIAEDDLLRALKHDLGELPHYSGDKGIVIFADNINAQQTLLTIEIIRFLGCKLPILVTYVNNYFDKEYQEYLTGKGISVMDIAIRTSVPLKDLRVAGRCYSVIHSPFKQVILVEPGIAFIYNPEYLFSIAEYSQTGALFWKAQNNPPPSLKKSTIDWINKIIPFTKGDNQILNKQSTSFQSNACVVLNKSIHKETLRKLSVLAKHIEAIVFVLDGEKELFWLAAELAKSNYTFIPQYPGVIGELNGNEICGELLYYDTFGNPIFFNNLIDTNSKVGKFTHFAHFIGDAKWKKMFNVISNTACLRDVNIYYLENNTVNLINEYKKILHDIRNAF